VNIRKDIVEMPVTSLKRDPGQPRKIFTKESIENMAKTIKIHGTINPIEVDEENVIITGEIRWRAAKLAGVKKVPTRRILNITRQERLERQLVENLHRVELSSVERENAIYALWKSGRFKSVRELAKTIGYHHATIDDIIEVKEFRDRVGGLPATVPTSLISETNDLDDETRLKILMKVARGEIRRPAPQSELRELVRIAKKAPEGLRSKVLEQNALLSEIKEYIDLYEKAPEPLKEMVESKEVRLDHVRDAVEAYREISSKGFVPDTLSVKRLAQSLRSDKIVDDIRRQEYRRILTSRKDLLDEATIVTEIDTGYVFKCPLCMNQYRIFHIKPTNAHRLQELEGR